MHPPILRLPTELSLLIFALHVESEHDSYVKEQYDFYEGNTGRLLQSRKMPDCAPSLTIAAVCQRWRAIALAAPTLWTSPVVHIHSKDNLRLHEQLLGEWLARAADLPLDISIFRSFDPYLWDVHAFTETMFRVAPRLAKLELNLPAPLCRKFLALEGAFNLEDLRLHPAARAEESESATSRFHLPYLPALKKLWINSSMHLKITDELPALVVCHLKYLQVQDIVNVLQRAPHLEQGKFEGVYGRRGPRPSIPFLHRHLKKLDITSRTYDTLRLLFQSTSLPALEALVSNSSGCLSPGPGLTFEEAFRAFLERSQCRLVHLDLSDSYSERMLPATLLSMLESTPSLTTVTLSLRSRDPALSLGALLQRFIQGRHHDVGGSRQHGFLPNLERLEIQTNFWRLPFSWETFLAFIDALDSRRVLDLTNHSKHHRLGVSLILSGTPADAERAETAIAPEIAARLAAYQSSTFMSLQVLLIFTGPSRILTESAQLAGGLDLIEASLSHAELDGSETVA